MKSDKGIDVEVARIGSLLHRAATMIAVNKALRSAGKASVSDGRYEAVAVGEDAEVMGRRIRAAIPEATVSRIADKVIGINIRRG